MEVEKGLKTLECLRGRLLAERQASRSAKEEAELMGEKVMSKSHGNKHCHIVYLFCFYIFPIE